MDAKSLFPVYYTHTFRYFAEAMMPMCKHIYLGVEFNRIPDMSMSVEEGTNRIGERSLYFFFSRRAC